MQTLALDRSPKGWPHNLGSNVARQVHIFCQRSDTQTFSNYFKRVLKLKTFFQLLQIKVFKLTNTPQNSSKHSHNIKFLGHGSNNIFKSFWNVASATHPTLARIPRQNGHPEFSLRPSIQQLFWFSAVYAMLMSERDRPRQSKPHLKNQSAQLIGLEKSLDGKFDMSTQKTHLCSRSSDSNGEQCKIMRDARPYHNKTNKF